MSEALSNTPIAPVWWTVTHFGSSSLLLPAFVLVAFGLWRSGARAAARHYVVAMTAAVALTVTSKCLFYGWGVGIAAIDFTGVSGHGLLAAAILPLLLRGLPGRWGRDLGAPLGAALALLVVTLALQLMLADRERLRVHAQLVLSFLVGGIASVIFGVLAVGVLASGHVVALLVILNLIGTVRTVVVPPTIDKTFWVSRDKASGEYLEQMGGFMAWLVLDVADELDGWVLMTAQRG